MIGDTVYRTAFLALLVVLLGMRVYFMVKVRRSGGRIMPERAIEIAETVAGALSAAHAQGVIHRDIKPGNIMLTPAGEVKVTDFGIARMTTTAETVAQTAAVLGTASYLSPEQAQGQPVDARSDLYSLGCVLYRMLSGRPPFQAKTLVEVLRLGAVKPVKVDVRLVTASNQELQRLVTAGQMREDLFFRINEFTIAIPPLRERKDDIPYLAKRFMDLTNKELHKKVRRFSEYCLEALLSYNWPGNVRQLRSVIRRAVLLADDIITEHHLDIKRAPVPGLAFTPKIQGTPWDEFSLREIVHHSVVSVEREVLLQVMKHTRGNKAKAARLLHIDYKTIHTKLKQFGINQSGGGHD